MLSLGSLCVVAVALGALGTEHTYRNDRALSALSAPDVDSFHWRAEAPPDVAAQLLERWLDDAAILALPVLHHA